MAVSIAIACIAGEEIARQVKAGQINALPIGQRETPFGLSGEIYKMDLDNCACVFFMQRFGRDQDKVAPSRINYRANMYALKDLGVTCAVGWGPAGAITHNLSVGDLVVLEDVIDQTYLRPGTFFEDSQCGYIRQFPVFCQAPRRCLVDVIKELGLPHYAGGTVAVREGPRLETPAEVRMLSEMGAGLVSHAFVPEVFLAHELELCYAALAYVVNYAETGSRHRPLAAGELFGGLIHQSNSQRLIGAMASISPVMIRIAGSAAQHASQPCECSKSMEHFRRTGALSRDWREWFGKSTT